MLKLPLKWMPAKAFGGLFKAPAATCVVVHCTESENNPGTAEALAGPGWFGGSKAGTSSHKVVDVDSICEGVQRNRVAYHAGPGGNSWGIAYEFCGRASWSPEQWRAPAQLQMLRNAAPHMADDLIAITDSVKGAITAARWLSLAQLAAHQHGLCTHNDVRLAFGGTTHTDPGPNFPYAELLRYVLDELLGVSPPALTPDQIEENEIMSKADEIIAAANAATAAANAATVAAQEASARALQDRGVFLIQDDVPGSPTKGTIWACGAVPAVKLPSGPDADDLMAHGYSRPIDYVADAGRLHLLSLVFTLPA